MAERCQHRPACCRQLPATCSLPGPPHSASPVPKAGPGAHPLPLLPRLVCGGSCWRRSLSTRETEASYRLLSGQPCRALLSQGAGTWRPARLRPWSQPARGSLSAGSPGTSVPIYGCWCRLQGQMPRGEAGLGNPVRLPGRAGVLVLEPRGSPSSCCAAPGWAEQLWVSSPSQPDPRWAGSANSRRSR